MSRFSADEIFASKGNGRLPGPDFEDVTVNLYGEYGFSPKWTGIFSLSYKDLSSELNGVEQTESGFSDLWAYLKKKSFQKKGFVGSFQFGVKFPLGYDRDTVPPLGGGQIDLEARYLIGKSLYPLPAYLNAELGYRKRNGDFSDVLPYLLEGGVFLRKGVLLKLVLDGIHNQTNDDASKVAGLGPNIVDQRFTNLSPALIFILKKGFGFELGYQKVIAGGNTAAGETFSVALFWQGQASPRSESIPPR